MSKNQRQFPNGKSWKNKIFFSQHIIIMTLNLILIYSVALFTLWFIPKIKNWENFHPNFCVPHWKVNWQFLECRLKEKKKVVSHVATHTSNIYNMHVCCYVLIAIYTLMHFTDTHFKFKFMLLNAWKSVAQKFSTFQFLTPLWWQNQQVFVLTY